MAGIWLVLYNQESFFWRYLTTKKREKSSMHGHKMVKFCEWVLLFSTTYEGFLGPEKAHF